MVVPAVEVRMAKLVAEEETAEMRLGIVMERMERMALGAASKFNALSGAPTESDSAMNSGGYGSNGADGAAAGNVFITVHDDDTDLLVPLEYDVRGGAGGASGQHGEPGDGGVGGRGGASHAWCVTPVSLPRFRY
jgi:hypothetical protein